MPRSKNVQPSKDVHICMPLNIWAQMTFYLTSESHGRKVPHSAQQKFICALIAKFFEGGGGVKEKLERSELQKVYDLVAAIDDMANHPQVAPEAFKAIGGFSREARHLLLNQIKKSLPLYANAVEVT